MLKLAVVIAAATFACIDDTPHQAASDATTTADLSPVSDPCTVAADGAGAFECKALDTTRHCVDGNWVTTKCAEGETCSRTNGQCAAGTLSCFGTLACDIDCPQDNGADCTAACAQAATVPAVDGLGDLNACQCKTNCWPILCGKLFPWPSYAEIASCVAASCADVTARCAGGGAIGAGTCIDVRTCALACRGNDFCVEGCFAQGDAAAQTTFAFYYMCIRKECGATPTNSCLFDAQANKCADLWNSCQGHD